MQMLISKLLLVKAINPAPVQATNCRCHIPTYKYLINQIYFTAITRTSKPLATNKKIINEISDPVDYLVEIFQYCPRTKTTTDPYKKRHLVKWLATD
jgi:hypothetical protein